MWPRRTGFNSPPSPHLQATNLWYDATVDDELTEAIAELDRKVTELEHRVSAESHLTLRDAWNQAVHLSRPVRIVPKNLNTVRQQLDNIIKTTT